MSEFKVVRPDILDCLANLSSDEVFTPPKIANAMLDLLPKELWSNPKARFCDPFTKSGVFLREIVKRLDKGLAEVIPDKEKRINHIFTNQVFGVAITQLTAIFSRRTLYCNKDVTNERSIVKDAFKSSGGNIIYHPCKHTWVNGSCKICGASQKALRESKEVENYAYPFLHDEAIMKKAQELGFDVVIGNPPYQMKTGTSSAQAVPLYHKFVEQAIGLNPKYLIMIIPGRWYAGGMGLEDFRNKMLLSGKLRCLVDYPNAKDCFNGIELRGGVCYFLRDRDYQGDCLVTNISEGNVMSVSRKLGEYPVFVRWNKGLNIIKKVELFGEQALCNIVSSTSPFGLPSSIRGNNCKTENSLILHSSDGISYISCLDVSSENIYTNKYKVLLSRPISGNMEVPPFKVIALLRILKPKEVCTHTYLVAGSFKTNSEANNLKTYLSTRFVRFLLSQSISGMDISRDKFRFVPMQDFSKPWTDEELYKKYGLSEDEVAFIESMIKPMDDKEAK